MLKNFIAAVSVDGSALIRFAIESFSAVSVALVGLLLVVRVMQDFQSDRASIRDIFMPLTATLVALSAATLLAHFLIAFSNAIDDWLLVSQIDELVDNMDRKYEEMQKAIGNKGETILEKIKEMVVRKAAFFWVDLARIPIVMLLSLSNVVLDLCIVLLDLAHKSLLLLAFAFAFFLIPTGVLRNPSYSWLPLRLLAIYLVWKLVVGLLVFYLNHAIETAFKKTMQNISGLDPADLIELPGVFTIVNLLLISAIVVSPFVAVFIVSHAPGAAAAAAGLVPGGLSVVSRSMLSTATRGAGGGAKGRAVGGGAKLNGRVGGDTKLDDRAKQPNARAGTGAAQLSDATPPAPRKNQ